MNRYRFLLLAALLAAGSASALDRGDAQLELAQAINAVQSAERDDAARYAAADLDEAHAMLGSAQRASDDHAWTEAATFAERAKVAGDLASARSREQRAEAATAEIERSLDTLKAQWSAGGVR